jgi:hypothetical protein
MSSQLLGNFPFDMRTYSITYRLFYKSEYIISFSCDDSTSSYKSLKGVLSNHSTR